MNKRIEELHKKIRELEGELETELSATAQKLRYNFFKERVRFEESAIKYHRKARRTLYQIFSRTALSHFLLAPVIYSLLLPLLLIDLWATLYMHITFPFYRLPKVKRRRHMVIDRQHLQYLNIFEKINCVYCGYANGLVSYLREIAGLTESYWCPIKHAKRINSAHKYYEGFEDYGDADGFHERMDRLRSGEKKKED